jgi:RecA/RadA recombinase
MARVSTLMNKIRKSTGSESFENSKYGGVDHWISTKSYALNRIISGDIYKGIPSGRVVVIGGESQSGKSLICADIASSALNDHDYDVIFYFDSEGGGTRDFFESRGCDISKVEQILLASVEDATIQILNVYAQILKFKESNPEFKALMILDSLGALVASKLISDAEKGKQAQDMGARAKLCNALVKACTIPALKTDVSIVILNHVYSDPSAMYTQKIQSQGGGKGVVYQASVVLQCSKALDKSDDTKSEVYYKGSRLKFFTTKNRFCKPFYDTDIYMDFDKGARKYNGLFDSAVKYGLIVCPAQGYWQVPDFSGEKKWRRSQLEENSEMWDVILPKFNELSIQDLQYSNVNDIDDDPVEVDSGLDEIATKAGAKFELDLSASLK